MFPANPCYAHNLGLPNAFGVHFLDFADNILSQLGLVISLPALIGWIVFGLSSFLEHVVYVVGLCSEKQVVRANASRVVALMQNAESDWNFPVGERP